MTHKLWTAYEAAAATGGMLCSRGGDPNRWEAEEWEAQGLSIDTRSLKPGEIFVALSDVRDGHDFIEDAFKAGASAALVTRPAVNAPDGKPYLVVRDTMEALRDMARAARLRNFGKRVAVTGSAGKTSTKDMLRHMLSVAGEVHAADRSFNNHFGVPLTLARMPIDARFGVFEIGMNHAGEITPLVDLVRPHTVVITTVAAAHLEFFDSVADIAEAKAEILTGLMPGGTAILPRDNEHYALLRKRADASCAGTILTFGSDPAADIRLIEAKQGDDAQHVRFLFDGKEFGFDLGVPGEHQAMNALAAFAAACAIGAQAGPCLESLAGFKIGAGRGAQIQVSLPDDKGTITLIDESYNANPASMRVAIELLGNAKRSAQNSGRRIAVLGEMLELGETSATLHAGLAGPLANAGVDLIHLAGKGMAPLWDMTPQAKRGAWCEDMKSAGESFLAAIIGSLQDGDQLMVKGSNASGVSKIADAIRALNENK